ncbi:MAG TPA: hypothetical protein VFQ36_04115 [Ktedonobacteraceae bacterium]|nr:hypothetical protein [Ktedonobacteraceae bacterium]
MSSIRFVPTQVHGIFDYVGGVALISAPFLFGFFSVGGIAVILPMVLGVGLIIYSLLTRYELGIPAIKFIPMPLHLLFDFVAAALIAVSPFLFGFYHDAPNVWLPHLISGLAVIVLVLVSQTRPRARVAKAAA